MTDLERETREHLNGIGFDAGRTYEQQLLSRWLEREKLWRGVLHHTELCVECDIGPWCDEHERLRAALGLDKERTTLTQPLRFRCAKCRVEFTASVPGDASDEEAASVFRRVHPSCYDDGENDGWDGYSGPRGGEAAAEETHRMEQARRLK